MREEPRRHRGHARRERPVRLRDRRATRPRSRGDRRQHLRFHRARQRGVDRHDPRDERPQRRAAACEKLVVAGCLSQRYPEELSSELPEVDHFLGSSDMLKLKSVLGGGQGTDAGRQPGAIHHARRATRGFSPARRHRAYVKIAEGCNRRVQLLRDPIVPRQAALTRDRRSGSRGRAAWRPQGWSS